MTTRPGSGSAPDSRDGFVAGLADAMIRLALSPELRREMGRAAIRRVESGTYDWDRKIDRFLEIYAETIARSASKSPAMVEVAASPVASGR